MLIKRKNCSSGQGGDMVTSVALSSEASRRRAEVLAWQELRPSGGPGAAVGLDPLALSLYELRVHQIELEMQNEELRQFQLDLNDSQERYFDFYDMAPVGYCSLDDTGIILESNLTTANLLGVPRESLIKQPFTRFIEPADQDIYYLMRTQLIQTKAVQSCELRLRQKEGEPLWVGLTVSCAPTARQGPVMRIVLSDITIARNRLLELERAACYDSLTKLPNRALLVERLEQALHQAQRRAQHLAVVFIDLDGFKAVNDKHGHDAGDHLLITLAERMKGALREGDILARMGGDEFVAVLPDLADVDASAPMLNRLLAIAAQPVHFGRTLLQVSASLGVTFYPPSQPMTQELEAGQLLRQADQAMYEAKQSGKNRFHIFDGEQDRSVRARHESLQSIEHALRAGEFILEYQPKVNLRTGEVIGVEALIRWLHPQRGLLPPADFLPMIADHPLAVELDQWVIASALQQIERWQQDGLSIAVSVNIGGRHLMRPDFVQRLRETLAAHPGLKPNCLELELLETSAITDLNHVSQVIQECRSFGVECALDDFGSGYSSLTWLKRLQVKHLKIDQSFVHDMLESSDSLLILMGVLKLASAFDMKVIAEGVETAQHGAMLLQLGCELSQGYGIARPMPADKLPGWIKQWKPDPVWSDMALVAS